MKKTLTLNQRVNVTLCNGGTIVHENSGKIVGNGLTWLHGDHWWIVLLDTPYNEESAILVSEGALYPESV